MHLKDLYYITTAWRQTIDKQLRHGPWVKLIALDRCPFVLKEYMQRLYFISRCPAHPALIDTRYLRGYTVEKYDEKTGTYYKPLGFNP